MLYGMLLVLRLKGAHPGDWSSFAIVFLRFMVVVCSSCTSTALEGDGPGEVQLYSCETRSLRSIQSWRHFPGFTSAHRESGRNFSGLEHCD